MATAWVEVWQVLGIEVLGANLSINENQWVDLSGTSSAKDTDSGMTPPTRNSPINSGDLTAIIKNMWYQRHMLIIECDIRHQCPTNDETLGNVKISSERKGPWHRQFWHLLWILVTEEGHIGSSRCSSLWCCGADTVTQLRYGIQEVQSYCD